MLNLHHQRPNQIEGMFARLRLIVLAGLLLGGVGQTVRGETAAPPDEATLAGWIADLDHAEYARRQVATRQLAEAGQLAIPLLEQAAAAKSPEVAARALDALRRIYLHGDPQLLLSVEEVFSKLIEHGPAGAQDRAQQALEQGTARRQADAVAQLEANGAVVKAVEAAIPVAMPVGKAIPNTILITRNFKGGATGLRHIRRLEHLPRVSIYWIRGSAVSLEAVKSAAEGLGGFTVQVRGGGFLGISAESPAPGPYCVISRVTPGSAADKAGLEQGDIIQTFNGKPVRSFEMLIDLLAETEPGDTVTVEYVRGGEAQQTEVVLSDWK